MKSEEKAHAKIDEVLMASGWIVQTKDRIHVSANRSIAICELSFSTGAPDYTLFVDRKALGTLRATPSGVNLTSVEEQSSKYVGGVPSGLPAWKLPLPFCYESTSKETLFTSRLDPHPRGRRVFSFHRPDTLLGCRADAESDGSGAAVERGGGVGVGGVGHAPVRHPHPPVHSAKSLYGRTDAILNDRYCSTNL